MPVTFKYKVAALDFIDVNSDEELPQRASALRLSSTPSARLINIPRLKNIPWHVQVPQYIVFRDFSDDPQWVFAY